MESKDSADIEDISIEIDENQTSITKKPITTTALPPRRSGSATAMNIYTEIKNKREEELLQTIEELRNIVSKLENEIGEMKRAEELRKSDDDRSMKKRKLREDDYENINEDILLQKKVDDLTEKLEKQDKELYEAREKMAGIHKPKRDN